jgi:hypothetical protein
MIVALLLIAALAALGGCAAWQKNLTVTALSIEEGAKSTGEFLEKGPCSTAKITQAGTECLAKKQARCPTIDNCALAYKTMWLVLAGVEAVKLAILAGDEETTKAALFKLLPLVSRMQKAVEVWR